MRFDTFKRHDFFQSFASIGRVDLVYTITRSSTSSEQQKIVLSIPGARAAQHSVRVKCPGAAVARAALMEPGLGLTLRRCAQSSEAARAEHTRYIYTLSTISTISTADTLHSSRQTTREKVDI